MDKKEKVSFDVIVYSMMIVAVIYAIVQTMLGNNNKMSFKIILGLWILIAVTVTDFVEPLVNKEFDQMKTEKLKQYSGYAITDAFAYLFIYLFVINVGFFKEVFHYVCLLFGIVFFIAKTALYKKYLTKDKRQARIEEIYRTEKLEEEEELRVFKSRGNM